MQSTLRQNNRHKHSGFSGALVSLIITALLLAGAMFIALNRQFVLDSVHFWAYHPSSDVSTISGRVGFTDQGKFIFYATRPDIESGQTFNTHCTREEQNVAVIGCYVDDRIYLYNVSDSRLDGIKEVTAAHEMLHAAYQRMTDAEKTQVNALVEAEYKKLSADPEFSDRMAFYARTEPGERDNELHSIIGTEIANISPELEAHYAKYFSNRSQIVQLHDNYNQAFQDLDAKSKSLQTQLDTISKQIDDSMADYNSQVKTLNADISNFNNRATSGGFSSQAAFNSQRQALQVRVDAVNAVRDAINKQIAQYDDLRTQYNATVTASQNLYQSIDSDLAPAPSV